MSLTDRDIKIGDRIGIRGHGGAQSAHRWTPIKRGFMIEVSYVSRTADGTLIGGVQITQTGRRVKTETYRLVFISGPDGEQWNTIPRLTTSAGEPPVPAQGEPGYMSCPRECGVDVRQHHSTAPVNGGCDTGPMSLDDMHAWFVARGAGRPGFLSTAELIAEHYGKTEDELDEMYDAVCGSTA